eukprot:m.31350 g.31350  ORF g.31350 m.31350 type:complete len:106 (+) comp6921_c0_seq1:5868-6185(+)
MLHRRHPRFRQPKLRDARKRLSTCLARVPVGKVIVGCATVARELNEALYMHCPGFASTAAPLLNHVTLVVQADGALHDWLWRALSASQMERFQARTPQYGLRLDR